jgi:tetratricopeptide (TPR) repeat protein
MRLPLMLVIGFVAFASARSAAQDALALLPTYRDAVRSYQTTQTLDVARGLVGGWTREDFEAVASAEARVGDRNRIESAAAFHLEIALGVAPSTPDGAMLHVRLGERLLGGEARRAGDAGDRVFAGRWYGVAASVFLAQTDTVRGREILERGLSTVPESAGLHLLAGAVEDMEAQRFEPDAAQDAAGSQRAMTRNVRSEIEGSVRLALAERAYRHALTIDPALVGARLRLGRVLFLLHRLPEARSMLEGTRDAAVAASDRYLARLFLSELDRLEGDVEAARRLLHEARAMAPDRQSAWLALAQLEEAAGRPDQARAIVREGLARSGKTVVDEWWSYRNGGLDREGLAWLRARVRR